MRQRNKSKKNRTLSAELEPIVTGEAGAPVSVAWSQTLTYGPILGRGPTGDKMVVGDLRHFSRYAVAY